MRLAYNLSGAITSDVTNVSIDNAHRTDLGAYVQADVPVAKQVRLSGGLRGDQVTTENTGGFFGDRSTDNGAFSGFAAATVGPFTGLSFTAQVSRGFRDPTLSDRYYRGPIGPRLHHRQSGSRRPRPACSTTSPRGT